MFFLITYFPLFISGKTLIWQQDISVSLKTIVWFSEYLKNIINNFFLNFKVNVPMWEFFDYEGSDVFQSFCGNAIGNPLLLFCAFFPKNLIWIFYHLLIILLIFLSGISFIKMCLYFEITNKIGILAGSMSYLFCNYSLYATTHFLSFIVPILFLPLIIIEVDRIISDNSSPYIYIVLLFLLIISSFYYFYMIAIFIAVYSVLSILFKYKSLKHILLYLLKIFIYSIIAIILSAIVLLPALRLFLIDSRTKGIFAFYNIYPYRYYKSLFINLFDCGQSHNLLLGFPIVFLICLSYFLINLKNNKKLFIIFLLFVLFLFFPIFAKVFNGFTYISGRWCFAFSLLVSFIISKMWDKVLEFNIKNFKVTLIVSMVYFILISFMSFNNVYLYIQFVVLFMMLIIVIYPCKRLSKSIALFLLSLISLKLISSHLILPSGYNLLSQQVSYSNINDILFEGEGKCIKEYTESISDDSFVRYSANYTFCDNNDFISKIPSTGYFCSFTNPYAQKMNYNLGLNRFTSHHWYIYDNSTILNSLSNVKYLASKNNKLPFGYKKIANIKNGQILSKNNLSNEDNINSNLPSFELYENKFVLPLVYSYDAVIDEKKINRVLPTDKQINMLNNAIVENYDGIITEGKLYQEAIKHNLNLNPVTKEIAVYDNYIVCYGNNQEISIEFDGIEKSETYLYIQNLYHKHLSSFDFYYNKTINFNSKDYNIDIDNRYDTNCLSINDIKKLKKIKKEFGYGDIETRILINNGKSLQNIIRYLNNYNNNYGNYHDYNINIGYTSGKVNSIKLKFSLPGIYTFDKICVSSIQLKNFENNIKKLNNGLVNNIKIMDDKISCNVDFLNNKFLCVAMAYYPGWKAYVDGVETKIYPTNYMHIGFDVPAGKHIIELKYTNVFVIYGAIVSLIGFVLFIGVIILYRKKNKVN